MDRHLTFTLLVGIVLGIALGIVLVWADKADGAEQIETLAGGYKEPGTRPTKAGNIYCRIQDSAIVATRVMVSKQGKLPRDCIRSPVRRNLHPLAERALIQRLPAAIGIEVWAIRELIGTNFHIYFVEERGA